MCAALLGLMLVCSTDRFPRGKRSSATFPIQQGCGIGRTIESEIDITAARDFQSGNTRHGPNILNQFRSQLARCLLQKLGQLKRHRQRQFPKLALLRLLRCDR